MDLKNQIELELYFADHFDTILFPVLADIILFKKIIEGQGKCAILVWVTMKMMPPADLF